MAGIILWLILGAWFFICIKLSQLLVKRIDNQRIKVLSKWLLFAMLLTAPVMDEIIGGFQFRALCVQGNKLVYEEHKVKGKTLFWKGSPKRYIKNTIIPIQEITVSLVEPDTSTPLITFKEYYAKGGALSRLIGFNNVYQPYTFDGICGAKKSISELRSRLNIETKFNK